MALVRRSIGKLLAAAALVAGSAGCANLESESPQARAENRKMDCLAKCNDELRQRDAGPIVARSQAPEVLPPVQIGGGTPGRVRVGDGPNTPPVSPPGRAAASEPLDIGSPAVVAPTSVTPTAATSRVPVDGDTQVRIVASVGNNPIYESEVREAVYHRLGEFLRLGDGARAAKEKELFREELRRIIEREMVLDEMTATLTAKKQTSALTKLREAANKEADARLRDSKKEMGIATEEDFRNVLRARGLTAAGVKRQIERGFMMQTYLREKFSRADAIGLADVREYYDAHPDEFKAEDRVKWQDLYVMAEQFNTPDEARRYAEQMAARGRKGEDFAVLAAQYSQGDSKLRKGAGIGEKPGEIFPQDLEPTILAMKANQVAVATTESGFHVLRVAERTYVGRRPFDEKLQAEVRRKVQQQIFERESKRFVETLWKRIQPQVWAEK